MAVSGPYRAVQSAPQPSPPHSASGSSATSRTAASAMTAAAATPSAMSWSAPYAPALVPILFAADLRDRIREIIADAGHQVRR